MAKSIIISKTRWFPLSSSQIRSCLYCGVNFVSTWEGDRRCRPCEKAQEGARVRAATTPASVELKAALDELFNLDGWTKARWAHYFDVRAKLMRWKGLFTDAEYERRMQAANEGMSLFD